MKTAVALPAPIILIDQYNGGTKRPLHKACVHCKKDHSSCDDQRPCQRCVTKGRADTCTDSECKKRGRPPKRNRSAETEVSLLDMLEPLSPNGAHSRHTSSDSVMSEISHPPEADHSRGFTTEELAAHVALQLATETGTGRYDMDFPPPPLVLSSNTTRAAPRGSVLPKQAGPRPDDLNERVRWSTSGISDSVLRVRDFLARRIANSSNPEELGEKLGAFAPDWAQIHEKLSTQMAMTDSGSLMDCEEHLDATTQTFASLSLPTLVCGTFGRILSVNGALAELTGLSRDWWQSGDRLLAECVTDESLPDFLSEHLRVLKDLLANNQTSMKLTVDVVNPSSYRGAVKCVCTATYFPQAAKPYSVIHFTPLEEI